MRLSGILYDAGGPLASVKIVFAATKTTLNGVIVSAEKSFTTQEDGTYSIDLEPGYYRVTWNERGRPVPLGAVVADASSEMSLPEALKADYTPLQPSYIQDALGQMRADLDASQTALTNTRAARDDTYAARDAAAVSAGVYADTAAGLAGTVDGEHFRVLSPSDDGFIDLYRNDAGAATYIDTFPSLAGVESRYAALNSQLVALVRSLHGDLGSLRLDFAGQSYYIAS